MKANASPFNAFKSSIPRAALGQYRHHVPVKYSPITTFRPAACDAETQAKQRKNASMLNCRRIQSS
jgi:hypothetical protein